MLLDTHAYLWWLSDDARLGPAARAAVVDASLVHVSAATIWEIAIKAALGRLTLATGTDLVHEIEANGFVEMPILARHAAAAGSLTRHHNDPFDRMLAAQASADDLVLVTGDSVFDAYGVDQIPASK